MKTLDTIIRKTLMIVGYVLIVCGVYELLTDNRIEKYKLLVLVYAAFILIICRLILFLYKQLKN